MPLHVYDIMEAPLVEVELNTDWWPGLATLRNTHEDGQIFYQVRWRLHGANRLDVFPADRVRLDPADASRGL